MKGCNWPSWVWAGKSTSKSRLFEVFKYCYNKDVCNWVRYNVGSTTFSCSVSTAVDALCCVNIWWEHVYIRMNTLDANTLSMCALHATAVIFQCMHCGRFMAKTFKQEELLLRRLIRKVLLNGNSSCPDSQTWKTAGRLTPLLKFTTGYTWF